MKLIDAIRNVIRDRDLHPEIEEICSELGIQYNSAADDVPIREYALSRWCCTDTGVGLSALYLEDEPVGCSFKPYRKSYATIKWISAEAANKVRDAILAATAEKQFDIINPDDDIGSTYTVEYAGQSYTSDGFYQGRPVRALVWYEEGGRTTPEQYRAEDRPYTEGVPYSSENGNCVLVQDGDEQRVIHISQFEIPYSVHTNKVD